MLTFCFGRTMDLVRMLISYNGRWEELRHGSQRYVGAVNKGILVQKNLTYEEFLGVVQSIVKHDQNKYVIEMQLIAVAPGSTCRTVNLQQKTCTCKVFDLDLLPCAHALAAAR